MSMASPTRTVTWSSVATGGCVCWRRGISTTVTVPSAVARPFDTVYVRPTGPSSGAASVMRR